MADGYPHAHGRQRSRQCVGQGEDLVDEHRRPGAGFGEGDRVSWLLSVEQGLDPRVGGGEVIAHGDLHECQPKRAFSLPGRLLNSQGQPISGADLEVLARTSGSSTTKLISRAVTGGDGSFTAKVPAGPSRVLEVVYRAFSADPAYAAQATVSENVQAGVQLQISPRQTTPMGKITLSGRVLGPIPKGGVVVELLVHYLGHWEPFRDPRTSRNGRFRLIYPFQGGKGRFPFRAQVHGGQAEFPFTLGYSHTLNVHT